MGVLYSYLTNLFIFTFTQFGNQFCCKIIYKFIFFLKYMIKLLFIMLLVKTENILLRAKNFIITDGNDATGQTIFINWLKNDVPLTRIKINSAYDFGSFKKEKEIDILEHKIFADEKRKRTSKDHAIQNRRTLIVINGDKRHTCLESTSFKDESEQAPETNDEDKRIDDKKSDNIDKALQE